MTNLIPPRGPVHIPVLRHSVAAALALAPGETALDCTAGAGGHFGDMIAAVGEGGRVIGLDRDERAHRDDAAGGVAERAGKRASLHRAAFSDARAVLDEIGIGGVDALLADIGVSSMQLDEAERGFSFQKDAPLDMRMDTSRGETAAEFVNHSDERTIADVIYQLGEERASRRIASAIMRARPLFTTKDLADVVSRVMPRRGRIHPATRTFQALRIHINGELDELDALLASIPALLNPGGRAAIISFHSLEDRRVKVCFKDMSRNGMNLITKKPLVATDEERRENPRARSAKLRVIARPHEEVTP